MYIKLHEITLNQSHKLAFTALVLHRNVNNKAHLPISISFLQGIPSLTTPGQLPSLLIPFISSAQIFKDLVISGIKVPSRQTRT